MVIQWWFNGISGDSMWIQCGFNGISGDSMGFPGIQCGFHGISLIHDGKTYEIPIDPINDGVNLGVI